MASGTQNKLLNYSIKTDVQMPYINYNINYLNTNNL